ncbi:hypothetical protein QBG75_003703 [Salmonella enterica]|nr:hypothetical protein [Salmonella enterica]
MSYRQKHETVVLTPAPEIKDELNFEVSSITSGCFTKDTIISTSEGPFHLGSLRNMNKKPNVIFQDYSVSKSGGVGTGGIQDVFGLLTDSYYIKGTSVHRVLRISGENTS